MKAKGENKTSASKEVKIADIHEKKREIRWEDVEVNAPLAFPNYECDLCGKLLGEAKAEDYDAGPAVYTVEGSEKEVLLCADCAMKDDTEEVRNFILHELEKGRTREE